MISLARTYSISFLEVISQFKEYSADMFLNMLFSCADGTPLHTKLKYRNMYLNGQLGEDYQKKEKQYAKSILLPCTLERLKKEAQQNAEKEFERLEAEERERFYAYYDNLKKKEV